MRKLVILVLAILMAIPFVPVIAQEDAVVARLEEYGANLPKGYGVIAVEDLVVKLAEGEPFLLDVRQPEEYEAGHLEGSINIPLRELGKNLNLLPALDAEIVVICKGGTRAMLGGSTLQFLGYNALILKGGYDAWVGEENPVTTEPTVGVAGEMPAIDEAVLAAADTFLSNLPDGWGTVKPADLAVELAENAPLLIDVRSVDEWNTVGYIEGAQQIWINEFMAKQDMWPADKDAAIVVYCASSYRGAVAYLMLNMMGYTNVRNMSGGINAWIAAELPVVGAQPPVAELDRETLAAGYLAALPGSFNAIRVADVEAKIAAAEVFTLVDVRSADEYAEGFIPGAINIPLQELTDHLDMLPTLDADIVVYCGSGHRSTMATVALNLLGYTNAKSMLSGIKAWTQPLTTEPVEVVMGTAPTFDPALYAAIDGFMNSIPEGYYVVSAANLNTELIEGAEIVLIDVRTDSEWAEGHIDGAIHLTLRDLVTRKAEWPPVDAAIVFYDSTSHRGAMAMVLARMLGYTNVRSLGGGTGAWTGAGFTLVQ